MEKLDVNKPFGTSVRAWRSRLGISQEKLAERANLHRTYISDVERGARNISLASIEKLARALEISIPTLLSNAHDSDSAGQLPITDQLVDILLVEDRSDDVDLTVHALRSAKISNRIHIVRDGAAALDYLFATGEYAGRPQNDRPQLVLLDLGLPGIDGQEVLRRIKADPRTRRIPVVVLTVSSRYRDIAASKRLGAEAYIVKPVDFQNLSKVIPQLNMRWALLKSSPVPIA